jgi:mRNA interferase HigB
MHIISRKALKEFSLKHSQSETPLDSWYRVAKQAQWCNLNEIKESYPSADLVGEYIVFNIKGNDYRLIVGINFQKQVIFIKHILTHADYDKDKWKT